MHILIKSGYNISEHTLWQKGRRNDDTSLGEFMKELIPRTSGNVYEKADKATWMVFPKEKKSTSFVDIMELTISDNEEEPDFEGIDIRDVINNIQAFNEPFLS